MTAARHNIHPGNSTQTRNGQDGIGRQRDYGRYREAARRRAELRQAEIEAVFGKPAVQVEPKADRNDDTT